MLFFSNFIFSQSLLHNDLTSNFLYYDVVSYEAAKTHNQIALWNPLMLSGHPLLGNPQVGLFYPFNILFYFINPLYFINVIIVLHIFLAGLFTFMLCRRIGANKFSSFIGGIIFMFSGPFIGAGVATGHMPYLYPVAWVPLLFLFAIKAHKNVKYYIPISWVLAVIFLGGYPQIFLYSTLAVFLFIFILHFSEERNILRSFKAMFAFTGSCILTIFIVAFLLLQTLIAVGDSLRSESVNFDFVSSFSLDFENLVTLIIPNLLGKPDEFLGAGGPFESRLYMGIIPLVLAFAGFYFRKNVFSWFFVCVILFSVLFSLGKNTPLLYAMYKLVPGFDLFRVPARILFLFSLSVACLASLGSNHLMNSDNKEIIKKVMVVLAGIVFFFITVYVGTNLLQDKLNPIFSSIFEEKLKTHTSKYDIEYYLSSIPKMFSNIMQDSIIISLLTATALLLLVFLYTKRIKTSHCIAGFAILIVAELFIFNAPLLRAEGAGEIYNSSQSAIFLEKDKDLFRVWDLAEDINQELTWKYNVQIINGYESFISKRYKQLYGFMINSSESRDLDPESITLRSTDINLNHINNNILNLLNVKYIITKTPENVSYLQLVNVSKDVYIYKNTNYLPRAFIVGAIINSSDIGRDLRKFDPKKEVLIEGNVNQSLGSEFKAADITLYSPNKITLDIELQKPGILVLSELYHPGWKAIDNGEKIKILEVNFDFRGILLSEGKHEIEIYFMPDFFILTVVFSSLVLIFTVVVFVSINQKDL